MEDHPNETKQRIFEAIRDIDVSECGEALDFGCRAGALTDVIQQVLPKWKVYGTDISSVAIDKAKKARSVGEVERWPSGNGPA